MKSSIVKLRRLEMKRKGNVIEEKWGIDNRIKEKSSLDRQVGGFHYKDYHIQPIEFMVKNNLSFVVGSVIKYLCRYNKMGGKGLQDLEKCIHYIELLIELEGWRKNGK